LRERNFSWVSIQVTAATFSTGSVSEFGPIFGD
jgi:hypothetical protein